MANLIIRVGAAVDRSVAQAFKTTVDTAKAAQRTVAGQQRESTRNEAREAQAKIRAAQRAEQQKLRLQINSAKMASQAVDKRMRDADREAKAAVRAEERKIKEIERAEARRTAVVAREIARRDQLARNAVKNEERARERAERAIAQRNARASRQRDAVAAFDERRAMRSVGFGFRTGGNVAMNAARSIGGFGLEVASDVARGAGVNLDLGSHMASSAQLQKSAVDLSNQGYMAGAAGANGQRQDPSALVREARAIGTATAFDPSQIMEGLQAFTAKTGDLATGRDVLRDMAVLSKATGTNLEDMVDAAGDVSSALGDIPNKGEAISRVMRSFSGQGKLGAVEIRNLATQMAKLGAASGRFEGSAESNLALMGAFAQEARQRGGASSATMAATAVGGFANVFQKNARFQAFKEAGVDVMSKTESGKFRNPAEIMLEAIQKTKANPQALGKMFADVQSQRVVGGFATVYRDAYNKTQGTETEKMAAGTRAFRAELERLTQAAMSEEEVQRSFKAAMETSVSKAQIFNNKLADFSEKLAAQVTPALEKVGPELLRMLPTVMVVTREMVRLAGATAKLISLVTGADDRERDDAQDQLGASTDDTRERITKSWREQKTISASDYAEAQAQDQALRAEQTRRTNDLKTAKDVRADDVFDAGVGFLAGGGWNGVGGALMALPDALRELKEQRESRGVVAKARAEGADLDVARQTKLLEDIRDALKNKQVIIKGDGATPAPPRAPTEGRSPGAVKPP